jgi:hypothetical protein
MLLYGLTREVEEPPAIEPGFDRSANFRWGGDETEMLAGMCAAALAKPAT